MSRLRVQSSLLRRTTLIKKTLIYSNKLHNFATFHIASHLILHLSCITKSIATSQHISSSHCKKIFLRICKNSTLQLDYTLQHYFMVITNCLPDKTTGKLSVAFNQNQARPKFKPQTFFTCLKHTIQAEINENTCTCIFSIIFWFCRNNKNVFEHQLKEILTHFSIISRLGIISDSKLHNNFKETGNIRFW